MSLNAATIELLIAKGLTATDLLDVARALEKKRDNTNAERQARYRAKRKDNGRYSNGVTPPNDIDILTPREVSEAKASSPRPWALPPGVSPQIWADFLGNRKRKRLGSTPTAWKAFCDDLARVSAQTGIPPPKLIEYAAAKGWGGIYDPNQRDQRHERPDPNPTGTALQRVIGAIEARH